jgi:demethylmenaquinone methyltransferase / 2-methoxy-6-polyprenyl-1,4-benzoquinol methylase
MKRGSRHALPAPGERPSYVRAMFASIAPRYDLINRLMALGQDRAWRREVVRRAALAAGQRLLDLGTGTGDIALEALRRVPALRVVGADFTPEMMTAGRARPEGRRVRWVVADALHLPFARSTFDAVASGYLLRNVADLPRALAEQNRVLRNGGRFVCLDTTPPARNVLRPFIRFHLHVLIPLAGRILSGSSSAYTYLPDSTESFETAEALAGKLSAAGFHEVGFLRRMLGTMAIHWGVK